MHVRIRGLPRCGRRPAAQACEGVADGRIRADPDEDRYVVERRVDIVPFTASVALTGDGVPPARPSRLEEGDALEEQREEQEPPCLRVGRR